MAIRRDPLPVDAVLDELVAKLEKRRNVVLVAPPGAGKTTRVPQAILDGGLLAPGEAVVVLEPRRLAARLASRRIAAERGVRLGDEVGYQVRFDDRTSKATRIAFLTEGILTRRIQSDPTLEGIGAVVLDEFHERSIHADLALAFLREIQETVRPELAIVVMSATLDPGPVARFLGDAPVVVAEGRSYPVAVEWLEEADDRPLVDRVVSGVRRALRTDEAKGHVLAFLPGAPEIRRAAEALTPLVTDVDVLPLYGELSADAQDRAVDPSRRRKVVLATNIAESSLTIEGVTFVVDSGTAKVSRHDPALGVDRLELTRISRSSADQRSGRAGRTAPGRALRLWTEKEDRTLAQAELAEIMRIDLAPVVLEVVRWSRRDPRAFGWFEPPPGAMVERALGLLELFGAIEHRGDHLELTKLGQRLAAFPVHPRVAMMLISAARRGVLEDGATIAALLSERDVMRRASRDAKNDLVGASDVLLRAERFEELARSGFQGYLAERLGVDAGAARSVREVRDRLLDIARRSLGDERRSRASVGHEEALLRAVLAGYPDRVARRRAPGDDRLALAGGGAARLSKESVVKEGDLLVAVDVDGGARGQKEGALVRVASQVERSWLVEDTSGVTEEKIVRWNAARETAESLRVVRYQDLVLDERSVPAEDDDAIARVLTEAALESPERALPMEEGASQLLLRLGLLRRSFPKLEEELQWLDGDVRKALIPGLARGRRSFADLRSVHLTNAIRGHLSPEVSRRLESDAPERLEVPSGRKVELRYEENGPPVLSVRLQEVFGMMDTPRLGGGRVAVKLELLAPNMRPVQVTQDLKSFWANTYAEVRNELRRRYPKHQWPEDPRDGDPRKRPGRRS